MSELWALSLTEASAGIRDGRFSPVDLVASALERIDEMESSVLAFVSVDAEAARREALDLAKQLESDWRGPLHGIPIAVKDIFDLKGSPTRRGSPIYDLAPSASEDASSVRSLRSAGAVVIGKTVTHEVACGVYSPPTRNPWNLDFCCGGSSGGSAAAVACGEVFAATGSDTGGSIRIPAALCGTVGFKPTYDTVSRSGVAALSWSLDHVGPIARTVEDAALVLGAMDWSPRVGSKAIWPLPEVDVSRLSIGVIDELADAAESDVAAAFAAACAALHDAGATIRHVSFADVAICLDVEFAIVMAEAAAYYAEVLRTRPQQLSDGIRQLFEAGSVLPATTYIDAQRLRGRISRSLESLFRVQGCDVLCSPTIPVAGYRPFETTLRSTEGDGTIIDSVVKATALYNLTGFPTVSVPMGVGSNGQPVGLQIAGPAYEDGFVLAVARAYEQISAWRDVEKTPLSRDWTSISTETESLGERRSDART